MKFGVEVKGAEAKPNDPLPVHLLCGFQMRKGQISRIRHSLGVPFAAVGGLYHVYGLAFDLSPGVTD